MTRETEKLTAYIQAVGVASTAVPDMIVDVEDPIGMMQKVVATLAKCRIELKKTKSAILTQNDDIARVAEENNRLREELAAQGVQLKDAKRELSVLNRVFIP